MSSRLTVGSPAVVRPGISRCAFEIGLVALLLAELLYVTITFDTQVLDNLDTGWARFLNWTPQYLRLAITITIVTLLFSGRELLQGIHGLGTRDARVAARSMYLAVHT